MASPLNNPWVSGGLGVGILVYFTVSFTPEKWKEPIRIFFTGELKREGGREPELKVGTEKLFRAITQSGPDQIEPLIGRSEDGRSRNLFRETPKGVKEKPVERTAMPDLPAGSGLVAIWMDGTTRVAVMTDRSVQEGEPWGAFIVEKITPETVILRHDSGMRVLRLGEVESKSQAPMVAAPPAESKTADSSSEMQLKRVMEMQKSFDPSKLLQGFSH